MGSIVVFVAGVVLPILAVWVELTQHICAGCFFDPLPTAGHVVYFLLIPAGNLLSVLTWQQKEPPRWLSILNLMVICNAAVYTLLFLPITPLAVIAIPIEGLGFLALAPLFSLLSACYLRRRIHRRSEVTLRTGPFIAAALLLFAALQIRPAVTRLCLKMAASDTPDTSARGLAWLRLVGDRDELLRMCYVHPRDLLGITPMLGDLPSPDDTRRIFYRVTGTPFNAFPPPHLQDQDREQWVFDTDQGGDQVGGRVRNLWIDSSQLTGQPEPDGCLTYLEWTFEFRNDSDVASEARAEIALPEGAVVSRMTLWMHGVPKEAEFGSRAETRAAYQHTVQVRRDPSLVASAGPDTVLLQCFPVPPHDRMQVRLGITAPWQATGPGTGRFSLPSLKERNFNIDTAFAYGVNIPPFVHAAISDSDLTRHPPLLVHGPSLAQKTRPAGHIVFVVDGSAQMQKRLPSLPVPDADVIVVGDQVRHVHVQDLHSIPYAGGQDNEPVLESVMHAGDAATAVIWVHGAQPCELSDPVGLRTRLEDAGAPNLYDVQLVPGPNRVLEKLDGLPRLHHWTGSIEELLARLQGRSPLWRFQRTRSEHSGDLEARDEVLRLLRTDRGQACQTAIAHHIVTPASSAVVLETTLKDAPKDVQQGERAWPSEADVETAPEPAAWAFALVAAAMLLVARRRLVPAG